MEFNFISKNTSNEDLELFMGPVKDDDEFIEIQDNWSMANILKEAGIFRSTSQARKNGWNKPIPSGFSFHVVGKNKNKRMIYILNLEKEHINV